MASLFFGTSRSRRSCCLGAYLFSERYWGVFSVKQGAFLVRAAQSSRMLVVNMRGDTGSIRCSH